jgi:hypothetical protein
MKGAKLLLGRLLIADAGMSLELHLPSTGTTLRS